MCLEDRRNMNVQLKVNLILDGRFHRYGSVMDLGQIPQHLRKKRFVSRDIVPPSAPPLLPSGDMEEEEEEREEGSPSPSREKELRDFAKRIPKGG